MNNNITHTSQGDFKVEPLTPNHTHSMEFKPIEVSPPHEILSICDTNQDTLVTIRPNGTVEFGEQYDPTETAKIFWKALGQHVPNTEKATEQLKDLLATQCSHGNYDYNEYMYGMANGMICALSVLTGEEPEYLDRPETWLEDVVSSVRPTIATSLVGTQPQRDEADDRWLDNVDRVNERISGDIGNNELYRAAADILREEIDNQIMAELSVVVEEEKVSDYERAKKGM